MTDRLVMTSHQPFSLLMSVYHGDTAAQLKVALESVVCHQTTLPTEIVLVKDGPVSHEIVELIAAIDDASDIPFKIVELAENKGLAFALNEGLRHCTYEWVARMDADDYSLPERFEKSLKYISDNPTVSIFGTDIGESPLLTPIDFEHYRLKRMPSNNKAIQRYMRFRNPFNHPTIFFKKAAVIDSGSYPLNYPEDYFLWIKLADEKTVMGNLPEPLVIMRINDAFFKRRNNNILIGELQIYKDHYNKGRINIFQYILAALICRFFRSNIPFVAKAIYNFTRKKNIPRH